MARVSLEFELDGWMPNSLHEVTENKENEYSINAIVYIHIIIKKALIIKFF